METNLVPINTNTCVTLKNGITIDYSRDSRLSSQGLKTIHLLEGENSPQEAFARAAYAYCFGDVAFAQRIYDYVSSGWFMYASPVLTNAPKMGEKFKTLPISCYLTYVGDSLNSLISHNAETAWLSVKGGGVGGHWSDVRAVSKKAPGPIPFMKVIDSEMTAYQQGEVRRGSYAAYLDVSHPDIEEFLATRTPSGGDSNRKLFNLHIAVNIPNSFMEAVRDDTDWNLVCPATKEVRETVKARKLWEKILETRFKTGEPYLWFIDTANQALPQPLKDRGLRINGSNLCVAPETMVLTLEHGNTPIYTLEGERVTVWNGLEWSTVTVQKTGVDKELIKVVFSDGAVIECTPEHGFYIQEGYNKSKVSKVMAKDLKLGDKLEKWKMPELLHNPQGISVDKDAYSQGFYSGDGNTDYTWSWLYEPKYDCASSLKGVIRDSNSDATYKRKKWEHGVMLSKEWVPMGHYSNTEKLSWLAGLLDADGTTIESVGSGSTGLQISSINETFLNDIRLMLVELGVASKVRKARDAGDYLMPTNKGDGSEATYSCRGSYRLLITSEGTLTLKRLGLFLYTKRIKFNERATAPNRAASHFVTVEGIMAEGRISDTYCFTEPKRNRGMFNGVVTANCNEIAIPTSEERTAVCCLSSVNLEKFDEWKDTTMIEDLIEFLDNVLQVFIDNAPFELAKAKLSAMMERDIGLGAMGFHSFLQSKGIPFESAMATAYNINMFKTIWTKAEKASLELGKRKGEAPDMKGTGRRNALLIALAPNVSSSVLCNTSSATEPIKSNAYAHRTKNGSFLVKNTYLEKVLEEKGLNTPEIWNSIILNQGSVQHIEELDEDTKAVFKTSFEIDQHWIVEHAAKRQPYVDQSQSINLFFPYGADKAYVNSVHYKAWLNGLKGLYYLRTEANRITDTTVKKERVALKDGDECLSCHG